MKKHKLTNKQYDIQAKQTKNDKEFSDWFKKNGINAQYVAHTDSKLLQAQLKAHTLLTKHINQLSNTQIKALQNFKRKMNTGHIRKKLKPEAAITVFCIYTKVVRKLHRQSQGTN